MPTRHSVISLINPFVPLILRLWKRVCVGIFLFVLVIGFLLFTLGVWPMLLSGTHEYEYFQKIEHFESKESLDRWSPSTKTPFVDPTPMHERPTRLIQDVIQLNSFNWKGSMSLIFDGTAEYPMQAFWIYVGGTAPNASEPLWKRVWRKTSLVSMPGGSCVDPPRMCNAYNEAFQQLVDDARAQKFTPTSRGLFRFMDCDNSPNYCDQLFIDPVMVIHVEVPEGACEFQMKPRVAWACNVKWSFFGLPLRELPLERKVRLPDGRLVPAFPSEYEQLYQLMMLHEGKDAMQVKDPPTVEWYNVTDDTRKYMKSLEPHFDWRESEEDE